MKTHQKSRSKAAKRQGYRCVYCGFPMFEPALYMGLPHEAKLSPGVFRNLVCTAEHVVAKSDGGGDGTENIRAAHLLCNRRRHARPHPPSAQDFEVLVKTRIAKSRWFDTATRQALELLSAAKAH